MNGAGAIRSDVQSLGDLSSPRPLAPRHRQSDAIFKGLVERLNKVSDELDALTARTAKLEIKLAPPPEALRSASRVSCRLILELVSLHTGISQSLMLGGNRSAHIVRARHIAYLIAHETTGMTFPQIGRAFDRDHSSIVTAVANMRERIREDQETCELVEHLRSLFKVAFQ